MKGSLFLQSLLKVWASTLKEDLEALLISLFHSFAQDRCVLAALIRDSASSIGEAEIGFQIVHGLGAFHCLMD